MNSERKGPSVLLGATSCSLSKAHRAPPGVLRSHTSMRLSLFPPRAHSPASSSFSLYIHSVNIPFTVLKPSIGIIIYLPGLPWKPGFPGSLVKDMLANARDMGSIPGSGRSPGVGNGNPLQYSCLGRICPGKFH